MYSEGNEGTNQNEGQTEPNLQSFVADSCLLALMLHIPGSYKHLGGAEGSREPQMFEK